VQFGATTHCRRIGWPTGWTSTSNEQEIDMSAPSTASDFHLPIGVDDREVAAELQSLLVELIDLALIGKQAHWNVEGPHFRSVHRELDELVDAWLVLGDRVAERAVTLGAAPDGRAANVAGSSGLAAFPTGHLRDTEVIDTVAERVAAVAARTRVRIDHAASRDAVTEDLLIDVAATLEQQLWMLRAQREHA
jgi:starvation-inducible DNA-binding protein